MAASYHIPVSGSCETWSQTGRYLEADAFVCGSLFPGKRELWDSFIPAIDCGLRVKDFASQVAAQTMFRHVQMGCYEQGASFRVHDVTKQLYLVVGQSGFCAYFKLKKGAQ